MRAAMVGMAMATLLLTFVAQPAAAAGASQTGPSEDPATLEAKLVNAQAQLAQISQQLASTQANFDALNTSLAADRQREEDLNQQLGNLARLEYEQPVFSLSSVLGARTLGQLLGDIAQARLVSRRQTQLLEQTTSLRQREQKTKDDLGTRLDQMKATRTQAAQLAEQALSVRDQALQARALAVATQAGAIACDPAQPSGGCPAGSIQQIISGAFAAQGTAGVAWGLRIAKCESGYNPRAVNPSGASGLFQFMPSTFANTPPGRAGGSIWDAVAQSQAAAWMYSQGRQHEWQCN
jgi:soluble lytic murein transglycosylase-like protein